MEIENEENQPEVDLKRMYRFEIHDRNFERIDFVRLKNTVFYANVFFQVNFVLEQSWVFSHDPIMTTLQNVKDLDYETFIGRKKDDLIEMEILCVEDFTLYHTIYRSPAKKKEFEKKIPFVIDFFKDKGFLMDRKSFFVL